MKIKVEDEIDEESRPPKSRQKQQKSKIKIKDCRVVLRDIKHRSKIQPQKEVKIEPEKQLLIVLSPQKIVEPIQTIKVEKEEIEESSINFVENSEIEINKNVKQEEELQLSVILPEQRIKINKNVANVDNHQCNIRKKGFKTATTLKIHKPIHNKKLQCEICDKNYSNKYHLKIHITSVHENPGSFKCQICSLGCNTKSNLKYHQKIHNPNRPKRFNCGKCDYSTDIKGSFQGHLKTHDKIIERCEKCNTKLSKNIIHDCSLDCKFCDKRYSKKSAIAEHIIKYHAHETGRAFFECDICGLKVNRKMILQNHIEAKHANGKPQTFICDLDGKIFKFKNHIVQHMKSHLPPVKCDFCDAKLTIRSLKVHVQDHHTGIKYPKKRQIKKTGSFECPICFKVLTTNVVLKSHINGHNKTIKCQFCERMFGCKSKLKQHVKDYHENPERYSCLICGRKFMQKAHLKSHMMTHDKNRSRNFKCTLCDFATFEQKGLENHLNFHKQKDVKNAAMKNPHKCPKCLSILKSELSLQKHLKRVHTKVLVECDICGVKMKQKSHLLRHIRYVHKKF